MNALDPGSPLLAVSYSDADKAQLENIHDLIGKYGIGILAAVIGRAVNGNPDGWTIKVKP